MSVDDSTFGTNRPFNSANYAPCPDCLEGTLVWDETTGGNVCTGCDGPVG
ncbi:hypothetical protein [Halorarius halobius]|nr:hypothetical protein [Halorarius halobius]